MGTKHLLRLPIAPTHLCVCLKELKTESDPERKMAQSQELVSQGVTITVAVYSGPSCLEVPDPRGSTMVQPPVSRFEDGSPWPLV